MHAEIFLQKHMSYIILRVSNLTIMQTKKIICMSRLLSKIFSSFPDSVAKVRLGFR